MQWNADSFIKEKKGVLSWLFKVYVSFNETDLFTIQKGTIKLSDSFNKLPAKLILKSMYSY